MSSGGCEGGDTMIGDIIDLVAHVICFVLAMICFHYGFKCEHFEISLILYAVGFLLLK